MAALQVHRRKAYAAVEAPQEEGTGREGAAEVLGARAQDDWDRRGPTQGLVPGRVQQLWGILVVGTA